jgi:HPt (histidine-containing phosphotransfer) domain-containing protein
MEMYLDILRSFVEFTPAELDKLCQVSEQSLPVYAIDVHTVKGSCATIGAKDLADFAKRLELMAKAGDLSGVLAENKQFIKEAEKLVEDIQLTLSKLL